MNSKPLQSLHFNRAVIVWLFDTFDDLVLQVHLRYARGLMDNLTMNKEIRKGA